MSYETSITPSLISLRSFLQQFPTLPNARFAVVSCNCSERNFDGLIRVEPDLVDEAVQSSPVEYRFHLAEDCFDGVEFRAIGYVENWSDVELYIPRSDFFGLMYCQLIHEER